MWVFYTFEQLTVAWHLLTGAAKCIVAAIVRCQMVKSCERLRRKRRRKVMTNGEKLSLTSVNEKSVEELKELNGETMNQRVKKRRRNRASYCIHDATGAKFNVFSRFSIKFCAIPIVITNYQHYAHSLFIPKPICAKESIKFERFFRLNMFIFSWWRMDRKRTRSNSPKDSRSSSTIRRPEPSSEEPPSHGVRVYSTLNMLKRTCYHYIDLPLPMAFL